MRIEKGRKILSGVLAMVMVLTVAMNGAVVHAAGTHSAEEAQIEEYIQAYTACDFQKYVESNGNTVIHVTNSQKTIDDELILEESTKNIIYNGEVVGYYTSIQSDELGLLDTINSVNSSSTWRDLGTNSYVITATGAGATAAILAILAGLMGGPLASGIVGGLSAFIGTATTGGTLTVRTWERTIGTQYYQKYSVKFKTSTGEIWGPVETIKAF